MLNILKKCFCAAFFLTSLLASSTAVAYYELGFIGGDMIDPTNWTVGNNWEPYHDIPYEADPNIPSSNVDLVGIGNNCVIPSGYVAYVRDLTLTVNYPGQPELLIPPGPANQNVSLTVKSGAFIRSDFNFYFGYYGPYAYKTILNVERGATVSVGWSLNTGAAGAGDLNVNGNIIVDGLYGPIIGINAHTHIDFDWSGKMVLKGDFRPHFSNFSSWVQEGLITDRGVAYGQSGWGTTNGLKTAYDGNNTTITSVAYTPDPCAASDPHPVDKYDNVYPGQTLSWTAPVFGPNNMSYKLYLSTNPNLNVTPVSLTGTSYTPASLVKENTYYWRVDIVNADTGTTVKTGFRWEFTLPLTARPELIAPADDANDVVASTVTLQWMVDSYATENKLAIRLITDANWTESTVTGTSYHPTGLAEGETYQWKIKSVFPDTSVLESSTWTFSTVTPICNGGQRLQGDENGDCKVDIADLAVTASRWLR